MTTSRRPSDRPAAGADPLQVLTETAHAVRELVGADGVGVTMVLRAGVAYGCANPFTTAIDEIQYRLMEGPCVTATTTQVVTRSTTIAAGEQRWPRFVVEAAPRALRGVVSVPLVAGSAAVGSLNLYSRELDGLVDLDDDDARRLADQVMPTVRNTRLLTIAATNARALREDRQALGQRSRVQQRPASFNQASDRAPGRPP